uniref:Reverse transcriptase Ty1/copia-type domain-containing protein n=1 Tax=Physcomitrium patens TaxID=3218 RepID=A0A2K1K854_PHYPA|nr:hypothetical protein PHYPA_011855 [Physcomitrium patens]
MLIAVKKMTKICILKTQINRKFEIKYLGLIKKILDIKIGYIERVFSKLKIKYRKLIKKKKYKDSIPYSSDVRSLMWAMFCTRPIISYIASMISRLMLQETIVQSMTKTKYMVAVEATKLAIWLKQLIGELELIQENT